MKIADLDFYLLDPAGSTADSAERTVLVRLATASGQEGWGEARIGWRKRAGPAPRQPAADPRRAQRRRYRRAAGARRACAIGTPRSDRNGVVGFDWPLSSAAAVSPVGRRISATRTAGDALARGCAGACRRIGARSDGARVCDANRRRERKRRTGPGSRSGSARGHDRASQAAHRRRRQVYRGRCPRTVPQAGAWRSAIVGRSAGDRAGRLRVAGAADERSAGRLSADPFAIGPATACAQAARRT